MEADTASIGDKLNQFRNLVHRKPFAIALILATAQILILTVGWVATYFTTHESVGNSVQEIIIQNNTSVAESLISAIGDLPGDFNQQDPKWDKAQTFIEEVQLGSGGFACILNAGGEIVCHPEIQAFNQSTSAISFSHLL